MERFVGITAAGLAACAVALAVPAAPLGNHLPGCGRSAGTFARGSSGPPLRLRVATIPRIPRGTDGVRWVITVTNRASRPRRLKFSDGAYAEIQLWQGGRRMYSWYRRRLWTQAVWGLEIPARSSWGCIQYENWALGLPPGRYTLVAYLRTTGQQPRVHREIAVS
jgi:Intracellular proteinase inhibitor